MKKFSFVNFEFKKLLTWTNLIILIIVVLAVFTRFYKLTELPVGLNLDEAATAYDAFCLAHWRVNRQLMHLPVYLPNFGGGQSALYAYILAVFIKIFGLNTFIIRLPGALFSLLVILVGALIVKETLGKKAGLLAAFLLTIFPYFICQGRFGWDCNLLLGCFTASFFFLLLALKKQKWFWWSLTGLSFGVTLYAYALGWVVLPVFLLLTVIYLFYLKKITWRQLFAFAVPLFILALPLIVFVIINVFDLDPVFGRFFYIPKLNLLRTDEFSVGDPLLRFLQLPKTLLYVDDPNNFQSFMTGWTLYAFSVPFFFFGLVQVIKQAYLSLKKKKFAPEALICFWFVGGLTLTAALGTVLHNQNSLFFPLAFCIVYGLVWFAQLFKSSWQKFYWTIIIVIYTLTFAHFCQAYFVNYANQGYQIHFDDTPEAALAGLYQWGEEHGLNKDQINQHTIWLDVKYIYYYLGAQISPLLGSPTLDVLNEVRYQNFQFEFLPARDLMFDFIPKELYPRDIFVLSNKVENADYISDLVELNFQEVYRDQKWSVWLNENTILSPTASQSAVVTY